MDSTLFGGIVTGVCTVVGAATAAYLGSKPSREAADMVDARAEKESRWRRIEEAARLAARPDEGEATLGVDLLSSMTERWNHDPDQRMHIKIALQAALKPEVEAYRSGRAKRVVTSGLPSPGVTPLGGG